MTYFYRAGDGSLDSLRPGSATVLYTVRFFSTKGHCINRVWIVLQIRVTTQENCDAPKIIKYKVEFCGEECKFILELLLLSVANLQLYILVKHIFLILFFFFKCQSFGCHYFYILWSIPSTSFQIPLQLHQQLQRPSPQQVSLNKLWR